jgi:hypothetical protein
MCPACAVGKMCAANFDCASQACSAITFTCVPNQCIDAHKDGTETDIDCGGPICPACPVGKQCFGNFDCASQACDALLLICVPTQCNDHHQDGVETDVDCGGGSCMPCGPGQLCQVATDCVSGNCVGNICQ